MRISDWSSDVCSADLLPDWIGRIALAGGYQIGLAAIAHHSQSFDVGGQPNPVDRGDLHGSGPIGRVHGEAPDRDILLPHIETPRLVIADTALGLAADLERAGPRHLRPRCPGGHAIPPDPAGLVVGHEMTGLPPFAHPQATGPPALHRNSPP